MHNAIKKSLIVSLILFTSPIIAQQALNKEILAQQCRDLALTVSSLATSQSENNCVMKLNGASMKINNSAFHILGENNPAAKQELSFAISDLQFAELLNCNRYIQISHSKFEAQRIKNSI